MEPIYCAAVDQRGEHSESLPEGGANGAECKDHVKLIARLLNEVVEESHRRAVGLFASVALPIKDAHLLTHFLLLIGREEVGHLSSVQKIVQVFHERLLFYLSVSKEEDTMVLRLRGLSQNALEIFVPIVHAISFG